MLYKILWSPDAENDLGELYGSYAQNSVKVAVKVYNGILGEVDLLAHNPNIAAIEPLLSSRAKTYRSLVVSKGRFKVIYFVEGVVIFITHVWNCRRNPKRLRIRY